MSDDEAEYRYSDDGGSDVDYAYGSEDEDQDDQEDHEIENSFYEGDDCIGEDPKRALELFDRVVTLAKEKGGDELKWAFKALQNIVTVHFKLQQYREMAERYEQMLGYTGAVTKNECTDSINRILDTISTTTDLAVLTQMISTTLHHISSNERLWFSTNMRFVKIYMAAKDYPAVTRVIRDLHRSCTLDDGRDDVNKATYLLEVYAHEIQLCRVTKNTARMKEILSRALKLNAAVPDPRIMGIVHEEGGKMHMMDRQWSQAYTEFNEGFRAHQEAGNAQARDCLKYVVLANILAQSDINPFAATEARVYQGDREIMAMMELRAAYDANDLPRFERTLQDRSNRILIDPFMVTYVEELRRRMREQVLLSMIGPYSKLRLDFAAKELRLTVDQIEALLVDLILDKRINGQIDQINGSLLLEKERHTLEERKHEALSRWTGIMHGLSGSVGASVLMQ